MHRRRMQNHGKISRIRCEKNAGLLEMLIAVDALAFRGDQLGDIVSVVARQARRSDFQISRRIVAADQRWVDQRHARRVLRGHAASRQTVA